MKANRFTCREEGLSLPETLLAMLLLSISLLGLLNYYQSLSDGFNRQWQVRQAWSEAHDQLESFAVTGKGKALEKRGWRAQITENAVTADCQRITATVETPLRYKSQLSRWICPL
ncbi:prepilin-type N-terminal cleavage/methylation domain-containing protein [Rouxiella chamberiensis]|uniref:Prepilin-type cleavage/methylation domain-containing protein n=1 Tax=Rouxiella chamberiensis TaxID=1513468 RepID=A0ABY7HQC6_9GAMM|nr:prepilin-type N-terminal cleavage/methylation domain-containing protein [Rouxiella chamberiensis]WAT01232.1 prepilin-type cleavage/methylation domain-containing protein [Rouxiella chamberiensis]